MSALFDAYVEAKEFEVYFNAVKQQTRLRSASLTSMESSVPALSFDELSIDPHDGVDVDSSEEEKRNQLLLLANQSKLECPPSIGRRHLRYLLEIISSHEALQQHPKFCW